MSRAESSRSAPAAAAVAIAAVALTVAAVLALAPPRPLPDSAPAEVFAAGRAIRHVERLATAPRVPGTEKHARALHWLTAELESLGLEPEVQRGTVLRDLGGVWLGVELANVVARIPGRSPSGAVLLMAHYDSRSQTFGAGDDAAGIATLLETVRAVQTGPPPANDLIVLATDGEELGLLGASLFVDEHRWAADVAVALNFEGRGNRGAVTMFETSAGNRALIEALAAAPYPVANSLSYEVYRWMPNDTDLSVFKRAGIAGMNFAFLGDHPAYHTRLDRPESLSRATLQHLGSYALALTRQLGEARLPLAAGGDAVYFNPWGHWLVRYPQSWGAAWVGLAAALALVGLVLGGRRGRLGARGVLTGCGLLIALPVAGLAAGKLLWHLLGRFTPALLAAPHGLPYPSGALGVAGLLALAGVAAALAGAWAGARRPVELVLGVAIGWIGIAAASQWLTPGAGFFFVWPALGMTAGVLASVAGSPGRRRELVILGVAAVPTLTIAAAALPSFWEALTVRAAGAVGIVAALALTPLLPHLAELQRAGRGRLGWLLSSSSLVLLVGVAALFSFDAAKPRVGELMFVDDRDAGAAAWWSPDASPDAWAERVLAGGGEAPPPVFLSSSSRPWRTAEATPTDLPAPTLRVLDERRDGEARTLEVLVSSRRGAPVLRLHAESSIPIRLLSVGDRTAEPRREGDGEVDLVLYGVGPEGVRLRFGVPGRWPIEATLADQSYGLPADERLDVEPAADRMPSTSWLTDSIFVVHTELF